MHFILAHSKLAATVCLALTLCIDFSLLAWPQGDEVFLGVVEDGLFNLLAPCTPLGCFARLTSISMTAAIPPEAGELDLSPYEGKVIVVQGHDGGGWIYSASVVEVAPPLLGGFLLECYPPDFPPLVINEVEMNPSGEDSGAEWIELYNPSSREISLIGWQISTTDDGGWESLPAHRTIAPYGFYVFPYATSQLNEENGAPIQLKNPAGVVADATPEGLTDTHDDTLTWQRIPNGEDTDSLTDWKLRPSTRGDRNLES